MAAAYRIELPASIVVALGLGGEVNEGTANVLPNTPPFVGHLHHLRFDLLQGV